MKNLLIVGGAGRNVGKTEFVCRLIRKIARKADVYALKVSAIFPDEQLFHGDHAADAASGYLFEETRISTDKDTSRMLRAGARRVFYLRGEDADITKGFEEFLSHVPDDAVYICESNSLDTVVKPGIHIMVKSADREVKPRAIAQLAQADLIVISDGRSGFPEIDKITVKSDNSWSLLG